MNSPACVPPTIEEEATAYREAYREALTTIARLEKENAQARVLIEDYALTLTDLIAQTKLVRALTPRSPPSGVDRLAEVQRDLRGAMKERCDAWLARNRDTKEHGT